MAGFGGIWRVLAMKASIKTFILLLISTVAINGCHIKQNQSLDEFSQALLGGDVKRVEALIQEGFDVETSMDSMGSTPLILLAMWGKNKSDGAVARLLIEYGANINAQDEAGDTPLHHAFSHDFSSHRQSLSVAKLLIQKGADLNALNDYGESPLHVAVTWRSARMVKLLLESGANVNLKNEIGYTAIDLALQIGEFEYPEGVDSETTNYENQTNNQIIKLLREHGAIPQVSEK